MNNKYNKIYIIRLIELILLDCCLMGAAYFLALSSCFNFDPVSISDQLLNNFKFIMPIILISGVAVFAISKLYQGIWSYASVIELVHVLRAFLIHQIVIIGFAASFTIVMPRSFWFFGALMELVGLIVVRFSYRVVQYLKNSGRAFANESSKNIMVIGAGQAGRIILREMLSNNYLDMNPVCVIDDNPGINNRLIESIPIVGNRYDIVDAVSKYKVDQIVLAIPSITPQEKKDILNICQKTDCKIKIMPGIYQMFDSVSASDLREVSLEDLLGRDPVKINDEDIHRFIHGKTVMVTGGGGSIGSELSRQLAKDMPKLLIIFDIYENNAYEIEQELKRKYPNLNLLTLIGSVRDVDRVNDIFETYRPDVVYHAAAHKHVPLMEVSPHEAIKNNVFGTYNVAKAAMKYSTKRFLLISTDKAVNPTNIMGASKRLCEMVVQMMDRKSEASGKKNRTEYSAVRFGNVLGSNGSVIPLFKKQISEGGPVTVTDKRIVRYFMTIPEAVSLVLQSSYYAKGGEIFVLDMGDPVRIDDMARKLIKLSGYKPDVDIKVVYTGLRPGEKLYEEMLMNEEGLKETENKLIHVGEPIVMDDDKFENQLAMLYTQCNNEDSDIIKIVSDVVPTYHPELGGRSTK